MLFMRGNEACQVCSILTVNSDRTESKPVEKIFASFNESWMNYWAAYVELQNQLYESIRAAREVSWLGATDLAKMGEINQAQREIFATMPRKLDYTPLGQITSGLDAAGKLDQLGAALAAELEKCGKLEKAIEVLREQTVKTKQELQATSSQST